MFHQSNSRRMHGLRRPNSRDRRGAIAVLAAVLMVAFVGMVAFTIDYGYIQAKQAELQRSADAVAACATACNASAKGHHTPANKADEEA